MASYSLCAAVRTLQLSLRRLSVGRSRRGAAAVLRSFGSRADSGSAAGAAGRGSVTRRTVDLRSDTVTVPGAAMRSAMAQAPVGDDVFGEDPTVNELQELAANMFGKEAALFIPTGTMSNLIAVMVHCRERGDEMILGDLSHVHVYEQGGCAQLAGVHSTTLTTLADGTFDLDKFESKIHHGYPDAHYARSRLVFIENTHNIMGGRVLPLSFLEELFSVAEKYGLSVHMDGARLMNAAVALDVHPSVILKHCHTVCVCLSKGLGAPVGTMLAGSKEFIQHAVRARKAVGGGMRQSGILAAAGKIALSDMTTRLKDDHKNARTFAEALIQCDPPLYHLDLATIETNIVRFYLQNPELTTQQFCKLMEEVSEEEVEALGQGVSVRMFPHIGGSVRAVWHLGINKEDTQLAIKKAQFVAQQINQKSARR